MLTVREIMTETPHFLFINDKIADAKRLMDDKCIRHVPIVSPAGTLQGVITQRDILEALPSSLINQADSDIAGTLPLTSFTERHLHTITTRTSLRAAALLMEKNKIGCLPVIDGKQLVGIITDSDFMAVAINLLEIQEQTEPDEWNGDDEERVSSM